MDRYLLFLFFGSITSTVLTNAEFEKDFIATYELKRLNDPDLFSNQLQLVSIGNVLQQNDVLGKSVARLDGFIIFQNTSELHDTNIRFLNDTEMLLLLKNITLSSKINNYTTSNGWKINYSSGNNETINCIIENLELDLRVSCGNDSSVENTTTHIEVMSSKGTMLTLFNSPKFCGKPLTILNTAEKWLSCSRNRKQLIASINKMSNMTASAIDGMTQSQLNSVILAIKIEFDEPTCNFDGRCSWINDSEYFKIWSMNNTDKFENGCRTKTLPAYIDEDGFGIISLPEPGPRIAVILRSPIIFGSGWNCKVAFKMLFYGYDIGFSIRVNTDTIQHTTHLYRNDNNKFEWENLQFLIGKIKEPFRVEIELFVKSCTNFMAIDDLNFEDCEDVKEKGENCTHMEFQCSTGVCIPRNLTCNHQINCMYADDESGELCGIHHNGTSCNFEQNCSLLELDSSDCYNVVEANQKRINKKWLPFMLVDHTFYSRKGKVLHIDIEKNFCKLFKTRDLAAISSAVIKNQTCKITFSYYTDDGGSFAYFIDIDATLHQNGNTVYSYPRIRTNTKEQRWKTANFTAINLTSDEYHWEFKVKSIFGISLYLDDIYISTECSIKTSEIQNTKEPEITGGTEEVGEPTDTGMLTVTESIIITGAVLLYLVILAVFIIIGRRKKIIKCKRSANFRSQSLSDSRTNILNVTPVLGLRKTIHQIDSIMAEMNPEYGSFQFRSMNDTIRIIKSSRLKILSLIGRGAFGEVHKATLAPSNKFGNACVVAVKKLPVLASEDAKTNFLFEALTLSQFRHSNIVECIGIAVDDGSLLLVQELMSGGDLRAFLRDCRPSQDLSRSVTAAEMTNIAIDIANGCSYLEKNKFIHRDIASRNCLLTCAGPSRVAKIADFGLARDIMVSNYYRKTGQARLPVRWMSPESLLQGLFSSKSDVWSFGILLWEIYSFGCMPYPGLTNFEVIEHVSEGGRLDKPTDCLLDIYVIMKECWLPLPSDRPSFGKLVTRLKDLRKSMLPLAIGAEKFRVCCNKQHNSYECPDVIPLIKETQRIDADNSNEQETTSFNGNV